MTLLIVNGSRVNNGFVILTLSMHPFEKYLVDYVIVSLTYAFVLLESFF